METELRQFIEQSLFCRAAVQRVAELLPPDDAGLDGVIADTVRENNPKALFHVLVAALGAGRRVEAKHLTTGATLLGHPVWLGSITVLLGLTLIDAALLWLLPVPEVTRHVAPALPLAVWQNAELTLQQPGKRRSTSFR